MIMQPDVKDRIENALREVAFETGRPYSVVERVFELSMDAHEYSVVFHVIDGDLKAVSSDGGLLPPHLTDDVNESYDEMIELADPVRRAIGRMVTGHFE